MSASNAAANSAHSDEGCSQSDFIFEAVAVDIDSRGVVETKPTSEEDWQKVQRATVLLAESTNLLKMPRRVAPEGDKRRLERARKV